MKDWILNMNMNNVFCFALFFLTSKSLGTLAGVPLAPVPQALRVGATLDPAGVPALPVDAGEALVALLVGRAAVDADAPQAGLSSAALAVVGAHGLALALGALAATAAGDAEDLQNTKKCNA